MKASDELTAKLLRQRLRSEGAPGTPTPEKRAVSAPNPRESLKAGSKVPGWLTFHKKPPRASVPTAQHSRSESGELDAPCRGEELGAPVQKTKVGSTSTPIRSARTTSDGCIVSSPRTSLRLGRGGTSLGRGVGIKKANTSDLGSLGAVEARRRGSGESAKDMKQVSARLEEDKTEDSQRQRDLTRHHVCEDAKSLESRLRDAEELIVAQAKELEDYRRSVASLTQSSVDYELKNKTLDEHLLRSREKIDELTVENKNLEEKLDLVQKASSSDTNQPINASSESALRAVMAKPGATVEELRDAIKGVEALLSEAQRELERGEYRQKRAAYEKLHEVLTKADEEQLTAAVAEARRVGLNTEDIEKGEAKLLELSSMTDGERHSMEAEKLKAAVKPQLFFLVKKNDYEALEEELSKLSHDVAWEDWRDHNGRTLITYAEELRYFSVKEVLASLLAEKKAGSKTTDAPKVISPCQVDAPGIEACNRDSHTRDWASFGKAGVATPETRTPSSDGQVSPSTPPSVALKQSTPVRTVSMASSNYAPRSPSTPSGPYAEEKKAAFKAAWNGDERALVAALENVPVDVWTQWRNQGDQALMEMSKSRDEYKKTSIHKLLLSMQGLIVDRKYEALDEGQAVWVFFAGDLVPRQATVREDTLAEAEKVLVQYWDGKDDDPAEYVDRCCVNRLGS